jgi:prolyl oligopeptidase PreP (S9A serine peptidase family)
MAAKLQAMGYEAHFYELATGGHSSGKNHEDIRRSYRSAMPSCAVQLVGA